MNSALDVQAQACHPRRARSVAAIAALGLLTMSSSVDAATRTSRTTTTKRTTTVAPPTTTPPSAKPFRLALGFAPRAGLSVLSDDSVLLSRLGVTETLVRATSSGNASPLLASSWEQITPTAWRFMLRTDVTFQDGAKLDAEAVVNSINRAAGATAPARALRGVGIKASAIDASTVEVTTNRPDPLVPLRLSAPGAAILSPAAYSGTIPTAIGTGTGIYRIDDFLSGQRIELSANSKYWGNKPSIGKVEVRIVPDAAARVAALRAGELDLIEGVPPAMLETIRKDEKLNTLIFDLPRTTTLYLNTSKAPFNNLAARKAVDLAIDRTALAASLLEGAALPAAGYFGPAVAWDPDKVPPKQNLEEAARQAVAGKLTGKVRLWTYPTRAELTELAVGIKDMLTRAGIDVELTVADVGTLEPDALAGKHDMFLLSRSYMVDLPDPAAFLVSDFTCSGGYNLNRLCDTRLDAELADLGNVAERSARERAFASISRQLDLDVIGVPIVHDRARIGFTRKLTGLVPNPLEQRLLTSELRLAA